MKKTLTLLALISFIGAGAQTLEQLDNKNGFRWMKFGMDESQFKGTKDGLTDGVQFYHKKNDTLKIGDAEFFSIKYAFYGGKLYSVFILGKGYSNYKSILQTLSQAYGAPSQPNEYITKFYWWGDKVSQVLNYSEITDDITIAIISKTIDDQKKIDEKNKSKKAVGDL